MECNNCKQDFESNYIGQKYCDSCLDEKIKEQSSKSSKRMLRNKEFIKNYKKDKKCEICGYNKYPEILVFHHKNKENKGWAINYLMKTLKDINLIKLEIEKCMLICPNCHNELHLLTNLNKTNKN